MGSSSSSSDEAAAAAAIEYELNTHMTVWNIYSSAGYVAGIWLAASLYTWTGSYRFCMSAQGLVALPMCVAIWVRMPESIPAARLKPPRLAVIWESFLSTFRSFELLFCSGFRLVLLAVIIAIMGAAWSGAFGVVLYWAEYKFGWGTLQQRDGLTLMLAMMMVGSLLVNRLIPVIGRNGALLTLFVIESGACVASGLVTTNAHLWVCLAFVGIGLGLFQTLMTMVSAEVSVEDQGRVQGASYSLQTVFWIAGAYLYWYLFDITITDDLYAYYDDDDHVHDVKASLWWWVTAGACAFCAVILSALLANKSSGGLAEKQKKKKRKKGDISGTFSI